MIIFLLYQNQSSSYTSFIKDYPDVINKYYIELNALKNKYNDLVAEKDRLQAEVSNLKNKESELNNTITSLKNDISNYQNDIKKLKTENENLVNKLKNIEKNNKFSSIKTLNNNREDLLISLIEKLNIKDTEIQIFKKVIPFELKDGEELLTVIFISEDKKVHYSFICKDTERFSNVESRLYEVYPEYIETENNFTFNGNRINRFKTLKENKIKNSEIIMLIPKENK